MPLAGNAFVTSARAGAAIGRNGLVNWTSADTVISTWFYVDGPGQAAVALDASVPDGGGSTVRVMVNGASYSVGLSGAESRTYAVGSVNVAAPGYVRVDLQGVSKSGASFGDVQSLKITTDASLNYANDAANYYWSRRGPSVHLRYAAPANTEYFYSEVTVPPGQDKPGSYFMANGFAHGYFGIQAKPGAQRWILFSVWDADNGGKTTLVKKGAGVAHLPFGGEGTGGQSYLVYNWAAGTAYRFLTRARPDGAGATDYSAWFYAPELASWRFIATWKRPGGSTYLTGLYSFLENFIDSDGYLERSALYGNQWARSTAGKWTELATARYTGDATAANGQRLDYAGGVQQGHFYLRNGGFFSPHVPLKQDFTRPATGVPPDVDVDVLPEQ
ncbi:DUF3472 domain-containing protein [Pseudoduganella ginsengisoli]